MEVIYKWSYNEKGKWVFSESYNYTEADSMPRTETRVVGGAYHNGDYWIAWAIEQDGSRFVLRSRMRLEDAKDDVMLYLQQRGMMNVPPPAPTEA